MIAWLLVIEAIKVTVVVYLYYALGGEFERIVVSLLLLLFLGVSANHDENKEALHRLEVKIIAGEAAKEQPLPLIFRGIAMLGESIIGIVATWHLVKIAWDHF